MKELKKISPMATQIHIKREDNKPGLFRLIVNNSKNCYTIKGLSLNDLIDIKSFIARYNLKHKKIS